MSRKAFLSANEAAAHGVRLSRPQIIAAYPITPQTTLTEKLSDFIANGELNVKFILVESEHSALAAALGGSMMGARAFTATSSQGLLYMCEMLSYVSGARHPVVMVNANRATATPWSIFGDQRDSMAMRDSGWIQLYCESGQEALDTCIQAFRLAEDPDVSIPVMVNVDGFTLTHTYDIVEIPEQADVDDFLPPFRTKNRFSMKHPVVLCQGQSPDIHHEGRYLQQKAFLSSVEKFEKIDSEFAQKFGRGYGLVEEYACDDADVVLVSLGSVVGTARCVVDQLRSKGKKVGLIKIKMYRPFPKDYFASLAGRFKALGVLEKDVSFGMEGAVYSEVKASMYGSCDTKTLGFVAGLGGRDIPKEVIEEAYQKLYDAATGQKQEENQFIGMRWE